MSGLLLSLIGLWVLLGAIWLAVWPLFAAGSSAGSDAEVELSELEAEKARLMGEIHELELDYATGKLSDEDRRAIEDRLKGRTIEVMKRIDALAPAERRRREAARERAAEPREPEVALQGRPTTGRTSG